VVGQTQRQALHAITITTERPEWPMTTHTVGILHPGSMGAAVAACAATHADDVLWCPQGRSPATAARARQYGLGPTATLQELLDRSAIVISLCPPAAAEDLARSVAARHFAGVYVEGNAISDDRTQRVAEMMTTARAVVDAAVVGSPPAGGKTATLYLSGAADPVEEVTAVFAGTALRVKVLGDELGQASALKLAYSSFQKASRVLAALAIGLAREHGVDQELLELAARRSRSYLAEPEYVPKTAARAWRWGPELAEAGDMLEQAGLPPEMLRAAAVTMARWDEAKDDAELTLADALARFTRP
jgi:3-hydroxyisobutyrate dehydrogenase-like beta-hydroxyacid dehydrogenase